MEQTIFKKLIAVMNAVGAIEKNRKNQQPGFSYQFRGIDDVMNELHTHFAKEGIVIMPEVIEERREQITTAKGSLLLYSFVKIKYTFYADDGSNVSAIGIGEAMDSSDKATNKAQSSALKYVLLQSLLIPTEEPKDVENDSYELKAKKAATTAPSNGTAKKLINDQMKGIITELLNEVPEINRNSEYDAIVQKLHVLPQESAEKVIAKLNELKTINQ